MPTTVHNKRSNSNPSRDNNGLSDTLNTITIDEANTILRNCRLEIAKQIIGQEQLIQGILMAIVARGHILLEGVPGLAKTLAVKTFSEVIDSEFRRMQFTPDLLPADLIGTMIYRPQTGEFIPRKGPIFSNIILVDEINRAPAKVQSALLEAMEEQQVTIGEKTYPLPRPFFVLATQNPIEQEGTYLLPEAQLDRFMLKLTVTYPNREQELEILRRVGIQKKVSLQKIASHTDFFRLQSVIDTIEVDERIEHYIIDLVRASRGDRSRIGRLVYCGASPRGAIHLYRCAKTNALFDGRNYVIPDDVKAVALSVLRHRIVLSYTAEAEETTADTIVGELLNTVPVP